MDNTHKMDVSCEKISIPEANVANIEAKIVLTKFFVLFS